ncbi:MAG TPA: DNA repair protein RadC [Puia sp.]
MKKESGIKTWSKDDRPREKLLKKGPQALTDSELMAILIRIGNPKSNAIELARQILDSVQNNLHELGKRPLREMMKIRGIGEAKAMTIAAALELGRRRQSTMSLGKSTVKDSREVAGYLRSRLADYNYEVFGVLYLNQAGRMNHFEVMSQGGITGTVVDPRLIFKRALEIEAVSIIVCHNHPSGNLKPSKADEILTSKLSEGAKLLDIKLLDHIIVGDNGYFSFADEGLLKR